LFSYRFAFPEFVPRSVRAFTDTLKDQLERNDMYLRRNVIRIPEFYVGKTLYVYYNLTISERSTDQNNNNNNTFSC